MLCRLKHLVIWSPFECLELDTPIDANPSTRIEVFSSPQYFFISSFKPVAETHIIMGVVTRWRIRRKGVLCIGSILNALQLLEHFVILSGVLVVLFRRTCVSEKHPAHLIEGFLFSQLFIFNDFA
jgi:hypothetical protein